MPKSKSIERREKDDYLGHEFRDELKNLYTEVVHDEDTEIAENQLNSSLRNHPEHIHHKEKPAVQESSVKKFITKQYAHLSPEKQAVLYAAASNPHTLDDFDPEVFQGKVDNANEAASLLGKMGFKKRSQEDIFA